MGQRVWVELDDINANNREINELRARCDSMTAELGKTKNHKNLLNLCLRTLVRIGEAEWLQWEIRKALDESNYVHQIENKRWVQDDFGWYWIGDLYIDGKCVGLIGNFYETDERLHIKPA